MPQKRIDASLWHMLAVSAGMVTEVVLAFVTSSLFLNQLLLVAAVLLLISSMLRLSHSKKASTVLLVASAGILVVSVIYMATDWLFFHKAAAVLIAAGTGLAIGLTLIANGKGLVRLPD